MSGVALNITVEGRAEGNFVDQVLAPHLAEPYRVWARQRQVLTSRDNRSSREFRGGVTNYPKVKNDITAWLNQDKGRKRYFTTMFDFYRLPASFPGVEKARMVVDPYEKVKIIEQSVGEDIGDDRFFAYIQLHEFEALILSDAQKLSIEYLGNQSGIQQLLLDIRGAAPEKIDEGPETAPSKRILRFIPIFDKSTGGVEVVKLIGLAHIRAKCPHFDEWLSRLESLKPR